MCSPVCSYRASLSQGLPFDYYLWQGGQLCSSKKEESKVCSPGLPAVSTSIAQVEEFEKGAVKPELKRLPSEEKQLETFLLKAEQNGQIIWAGEGNAEIYQVLQQAINESAPEQDVHLVFGFAHAVEGQTSFFNELISEGEDQKKIKGVTHLALEYKATQPAQEVVDRYLIMGGKKGWVFQLEKWGKTNIPIASPGEMEARERTMELAYQECYNLVLADAPAAAVREVKKSLGEYYWLAVREEFAVKRVQQRQDPQKKDVVLWKWGASHVEKYRLPFYLQIQDPQAKVVSVVVNGGTYVDALAFDRVLGKLGWVERNFVLKLEGYREADYIIHLKTEGRKRIWGISRKGNPVLQHLFDPPEKKKAP